MSFIVNGTTGLTFPDATNQTSAFLNIGIVFDGTSNTGAVWIFV